MWSTTIVLATINISESASQILHGFFGHVFLIFSLHFRLVERIIEKIVGLEYSVLYLKNLVQMLFV